MTQPRELKQKDLWPPYTVVVEDAEGDRVDLTSAAIFASVFKSDGTVVVSRSTSANSITFPTSGEFDYFFTGSETAEVGHYYIEWEIHLGSDSAKKLTIPRRTKDRAWLIVHETPDDQ